MSGTNAPADSREGTRLETLAGLAALLASARTAEGACEAMVEHLRRGIPGSTARAYLLGPGDKCATCHRARECPTRDRCFHLAAGAGFFTQPHGHAERVPRVGTAWAESMLSPHAQPTEVCPPELLPPGTSSSPPSTVVFLPLRASGEPIGVVGVRVPIESAVHAAEHGSAAALLTGAAVAAATARAEERRRFDQLLLVNALGRKVNSILNRDLVMSHAVVEIQRAFGYRHVTLFEVDPSRTRLLLRAQASRYQRTGPSDVSIEMGQGIVGRVAARGQTVRVDDVSREADYLELWPDTKSEVAVPIPIGGVVAAVINVESDVVNAFSEADVVVLETAALQFATALENARLFGRVRQSEEEYRTLIETSTVAILQIDRSGRLTYANPAAAALTGIDRASILTRLADPADLAVEGDREALKRALAAAAEGESQRGLELRARHTDGRARFVAAEIQPLVGDGGTRTGVLLLARDVTREKELQAQLTHSEKLKAMGEMVSGVAHELNNPLAGILGLAQLFLVQPSDQWSRPDMEKIEANARRCKQIVANLLAFARKAPLHRQLASVNEVIDSVIRLNEYSFELDNVRMVRKFDPRVPSVSLDVSNWQRVFINLAQNAREAMVDAAAPTRRITFTTRWQDPEIVIEVQDTGPGIPAHVRARIFDPFFTTKSGGTGLGLGLCFGIVTEHGGTIADDPESRDGASFVIRVPARTAPPPVPPPAGSEETPLPPSAVRRRALVVDDEPVIRDVVARTLELRGYRVDMAKDSTEALARAAETPYHAVLIDLRMPGELDGLGLHRRLQAVHPRLARRVVFMTGDLLRNDAIDEITSQGLTYVHKPFDIRELGRVVDLVAGSPETA